MKNSLIIIRRSGRFVGDCQTDEIEKIFSDEGLFIDRAEIIQSDDDLGFGGAFDSFKDCFDNVIICGDDVAEFGLRQIVCDKTDSELVDNETAKTYVDEKSEKNGIKYPSDYSAMPLSATLMPNETGACQGFILDGTGYTVSLFPSEISEISEMSRKFLIPYLKSKEKTETLKVGYFGKKSTFVETTEKALKDIGVSAEVRIKGKHGVLEAVFSFALREELEKCRTIIDRELADGVFSTDGKTLEQAVFEKLKEKNLKIATAESFTAGRVVSSIIKNSGASEFVTEGIVAYSNKSKCDRLGVPEDDIKNEGAVSAKVAYDMVVGLLKKGDADVSVSTTGIAGPNADGTDKPVGLCYIAVGTKKGVYAYKYELTGDREDITETAKNIALFLVYDKLKNI